MAGPLSSDLRERVVATVLAGESCRSAGARFGVSVSSVIKWSRRYRQTGSVTPDHMGGHRRSVVRDHRAFILDRIAQTPHLTLHGLKGELSARGVKVSDNAVWLFVRRERLRKKSCSPLNRVSPPSPGGAPAGSPSSLISIPSAWS